MSTIGELGSFLAREAESAAARTGTVAPVVPATPAVVPVANGSIPIQQSRMPTQRIGVATGHADPPCVATSTNEVRKSLD